jgi:hypothetical protein
MAENTGETGSTFYCPGCGVELKPDVEDQNFCEYCGTPLSPPEAPGEDMPEWLQDLRSAPAAAEPVDEPVPAPAAAGAEPGWLAELRTVPDTTEPEAPPEAETMPDWLQQVVEPPPATEPVVSEPRRGSERVMLAPKTPRRPEPEPESDTTPQPAAIIAFFLLGIVLLLGLLVFLGVIAAIR